MSIEFSRSVRALKADGIRLSTAGLFLGAAVLGAWIAWFFLARVTVSEASDLARLEVDRAAHPIQATVGGRIVALHVTLGQEVREGQLLVELDTAAERLLVREEESRKDSLAPQLDALRREIQAAEQALEEMRQSGPVALEEARSRQREADASARVAQEEADRLAKSQGGIVSEIELLRTKAEAEKRKASAEGARLAVSRIDLEQRARESAQRQQFEQLRRESARLSGSIATSAATTRRIEEEIARRRIAAPVAGRVGELADLRAGGVLREGERLGAVVPPGGLRGVAEFPPSVALGRIRAGQKGRLRLEGFPWTQYGGIEATVTNLAEEVRNGRVRVEFAIQADPASSIPFQHGMPGTVTVDVERVSPAALVLRAAGRALTPAPPKAAP